MFAIPRGKPHKPWSDLPVQNLQITRRAKTYHPRSRPRTRDYATAAARAIPDGLAGTVASHTTCVFLHSRLPPTAYPERVPSKLQRALQLKVGRFGGLVNFAWSPEQRILPVLAREESAQSGEWEDGEKGERYRATAFSTARGRIEIDEVSMATLDTVVSHLDEHTSPPLRNSGAPSLAQGEPTFLYVCTHGARDCRCGETGGAVYAALRDEIKRRNLEETVRVAGTGHVGGHKYAANVLVYPYGEWLGLIRPENSVEVLDAILHLRQSTSSSEHIFNTKASLPLLPHFWRGRMGLDKAEQLQLLSRARSQTSQTGSDGELSGALRPHASRL